MDEAASIVIEPFNDHYVLVYADRKIFGGEIEARGGKWNKKHDGWLLPKDQQNHRCHSQPRMLHESNRDVRRSRNCSALQNRLHRCFCIAN